MLYCLLISVFVLLLVLVIDIVYFDFGKKDLFIGLGPAFVIYLFGILAILHNFRIIRRKEVDIVFALAFKYRDRLFNSKVVMARPKVAMTSKSLGRKKLRSGFRPMSG